MPTQTGVTTQTISSTKMAIAVGFLGFSAMAAAAGLQLNKQVVPNNQKVPSINQEYTQKAHREAAGGFPNLYFSDKVTSELNDGKDLVFNIHLGNSGPVNTTIPVTLQVKWKSLNGEWGKANIPLKKLDSGEDIQFNFPLPFILSDVQETIYFKLDPENKISESEEYDNETYYEYVYSKKTILNDDYLSNLIVSDVKVSATDLPDQVRLEYTIKNVGKSLAGTFVVEEMFGNQVGTNESYSTKIDSLSGGEQTFVSLRSLSTYLDIDRVRVVVDSTDSVTELDDTDNHITVPLPKLK